MIWSPHDFSAMLPSRIKEVISMERKHLSLSLKRGSNGIGIEVIIRIG